MVRIPAAAIESLAVRAVHRVDRPPESVDLHARRRPYEAGMRWWEGNQGEAAARVPEEEGDRCGGWLGKARADGRMDKVATGVGGAGTRALLSTWVGRLQKNFASIVTGRKILGRV